MSFHEFVEAPEIQGFILRSLVEGLDVGSSHVLLKHMDEEQRQALGQARPGGATALGLTAILDGLIGRFGLSEEEAQAALVRAARRLAAHLSPRQCAKIQKHLPLDLRPLFDVEGRSAA